MSAENGMLPGSLELAYLGDTLFDLFVRERLVRRGGRVREMHRQAVKLVCAAAQAEAFERVEGCLTEEEAAVARRARNARQTPTKGADIADYHRATAFEALVGYLYYMDRKGRARELLEKAFPDADTEVPKHEG